MPLTNIEIADKGIRFLSKKKEVNLSHIDFKFPKGISDGLQERVWLISNLSPVMCVYAYLSPNIEF